MVETVVVGTDGSNTAGQAVDFAIDLAERYGARIVIVSSHRPVDQLRIDKEQADAPVEVQWSINPSEDVESILETAAVQARERGLRTTTVASEGDPAEVLCRFAAEQSADVLVVGSKGMHRRFLGSVPNSVSHKAPCSVVIVKTT